ncbi:hypothetical protein HDU96_008170 [Phlyctochytrium bullatum]|nr:hypothetical protein HDU96_008170 [Phlyctochytrium bullatum]
MPNLLAAAGIQLNDVQNGVLLCPLCRGGFDKLQLYIENDTREGHTRYLAKVSNVHDENLMRLYPDLELKSKREIRKKLFVCLASDSGLGAACRQWQVEDATGEMEVYFDVESDPRDRPSERAVRLRRVACLVWRMAVRCEEELEELR